MKKLAGAVILAGFDGTTLPPELATDIEAGAVGGIVMFKRNVDSIAQIHDLLSECRRRAPVGAAPLTAVDQEGGRVIRIREPLVVLPSARQFGALQRPEVTAEAGRLVATELRALGFTVNFAPVLDVDTHPASPVIGDRSFSGDAAEVIQQGLAFARGLKAGGVFPVAKHFPGHGDAAVDSHIGLPVVAHRQARLNAVELAPFSAWARECKDPVMTAHVVFPALDPDNPATASHRILTHLLRTRLRFSGPILTDDLEMGALHAFGGPAALAVRIINAGADGLLVCRNLALRAEIICRLAREASADSRFARRLQQAAARLAPLSRPAGPDVDFSFIGSPQHEAMKLALHAHFNKEEN